MALKNTGKSYFGFKQQNYRRNIPSSVFNSRVVDISIKNSKTCSILLFENFPPGFGVYCPGLSAAAGIHLNVSYII